MSSGFNIAKDFKNCEFIRNIADSIDKDKKDGNSNGYIDTEKEQSIFNLHIQLGLQSGDITEDDMVECFGIVFARSKYPAKTDNMQNADVEKQVENQSAQRTETKAPKKVTKKKVAKPQIIAQVVTQPKVDTTLKAPVNQATYNLYAERKQANSIIRSLANGISGVSISKNGIQKDLADIKPATVAYVYTEYKNKTGRSLAKDIDNEYKLNINDVKNTICKNLAIRAKQLNVKGIYFGDYQKINDIDELNTWITNSIKALDRATNKIVLVKNGKDFAKQGLESVSVYTKESGSRAVYHYTNGKEIEEISNAKQGTIRTLRKPAYQEQQVIHKPSSQPAIKGLPTFKIPAKNIQIQFKIENENAKQMASSLEQNKAKLMEMLDLDNETFDNYAKLTMAIAERETGFGQYCLLYDEKTKQWTKDYDKYNTQKANAEDTFKWSKWAKPYVDKKNPYMSFGMTGIKYDAIVAASKKNDAEGRIYNQVLNNFKTLGIKNPTDLYDPKKCAAATLIYAKAQIDLLEATMTSDHNKKLIGGGNTNEYYDLESRIQACPSDDITEYDVVANAWNRGFSFIKDGTMNPNEWEYNNSIRENMKKYNVVTQ